MEVDEELLAPLYRRFFEAFGDGSEGDWERDGASSLEGVLIRAAEEGALTAEVEVLLADGGE